MTGWRRWATRKRVLLGLLALVLGWLFLSLALFRALYPEGRTLVVAGGVAANQALRARLAAVASRAGFACIAPPPKLCTDNGAMIAWAGLERLKLGLADALDFAPRPRWPLDPAAQSAGRSKA